MASSPSSSSWRSSRTADATGSSLSAWSSSSPSAAVSVSRSRRSARLRSFSRRSDMRPCTCGSVDHQMSMVLPTLRTPRHKHAHPVLAPEELGALQEVLKVQPRVQVECPLRVHVDQRAQRLGLPGNNRSASVRCRDTNTPQVSTQTSCPATSLGTWYGNVRWIFLSPSADSRCDSVIMRRLRLPGVSVAGPFTPKSASPAAPASAAGASPAAAALGLAACVAELSSPQARVAMVACGFSSRGGKNVQESWRQYKHLVWTTKGTRNS